MKPLTISDQALDALQRGGCCTLCSRPLDAGHGIQITDSAGRMHRHCDRCHAAVMDSEEWLTGAVLPGVAPQMASSTPQNGPKLAISAPPRLDETESGIREAVTPQISQISQFVIILAPAALFWASRLMEVLA